MCGTRYWDLFQAVFWGESWERTKSLLDKHPEDCLTAIISPARGGTVLHVAVSGGHLHLVEKLVELMSPDALTTTTRECPDTPLNIAARCGFTKIAEFLVKKNLYSLQIPDQDGLVPVATASRFGHKDTIRYLYAVTTKETLIEGDHRKSGATLLIGAIFHDMYASRWLYGVVWSALNPLVPGIKSIQNKKRIHVQALKVLKCICSQISSLDESEPLAVQVYESLFTATKLGIVEIVNELIKINPNLLLIPDKQNRNIFQVAILYRQEKIFNLICGISGQVALLSPLTDNDRNTILHLVGKSPPSSQEQGKMPGAALQMQRELQWFKEVEKIVPSFVREFPNLKGLNPGEMFTEEHKKLVEEGEKWMKDTAGSCTVVATLITTFTFAAAFTAPGGFNQDSGFPIFLSDKQLFFPFLISDSLSLFSSSTSVLMFLSIYTSRYTEEDFLELLPKRLIIGLSTLFFSMATMMVAFCVTLFLILSRQYDWVAIPISLLAGIPVTLFIVLQFPIFLDMVRSTYGPGLFIRPKKK
ncbi:ankyrin repeat-containing protein ITN1-like isoform X2 [Telopea speciosissima]|uniref:ankyrin repeat-containing protein ITN1-like isoform X2 n=1 Tax=Telopea speciosissima TaxID=54955 RepID=UPI001CC540E0|nr:ankyrin repeat-containing protein ITN1-like isoform X2 [Telopea speciosissima]